MKLGQLGKVTLFISIASYVVSRFSTYDVIDRHRHRTISMGREGKGHLSMEENWNVLMNLLQNLSNTCEGFYLFISSPVAESQEQDQLNNFPGSMQNENIGPLYSTSRRQVLVKVFKIPFFLWSFSLFLNLEYIYLKFTI